MGGYPISKLCSPSHMNALIKTAFSQSHECFNKTIFLIVHQSKVLMRKVIKSYLVRNFRVAFNQKCQNCKIQKFSLTQTQHVLTFPLHTPYSSGNIISDSKY
ncbi:hypothetical protein CHS0354_020407 [Potamilus streckersoni]|uniref:Uncharacterized protein n=1 Tax=Potamilus streckersoni TaxID=2493646 RepID=A0AAE0TGX9_9BIVA|nr:hypothetical protein CHS0354_020407 [Potamilus streckersoni]